MASSSKRPSPKPKSPRATAPKSYVFERTTRPNQRYVPPTPRSTGKSKRGS